VLNVVEQIIMNELFSIFEL